jgi:phosphate-selective porin OprO/OprP
MCRVTAVRVATWALAWTSLLPTFAAAQDSVANLPETSAPPAPVVVPPSETTLPPAASIQPSAAPKLTDDHPVNNEKSRFRPGKGLHVESDDGAFALETRLRAQMLYTIEGEEGERLGQSFELRRARLQFAGHVFGKDNEFKAELALSPSDVGMRDNSLPQTSPLLDFYFQFNQIENLSFRVGQYKVPYSRQRVVSSGDLRMVDRSIVNSEFNLDRDIGFDFRSENFLGLDRFRYYAGLYVGEGRNTNALRDFGMMYLGRIEYLPFGDFKDYSEGDLSVSKTPKLSIGAAYGFIEHAGKNQGILGSAPADGGTANIHNFDADFVFRVMGLSVEGELALRSGKRRPGSELSDVNDTPDDSSDDELLVEAPRNGWGLVGQAGYLLPGTGFEVVVRGAMNRATERSSMTERNEYGLGVNYYFAGHPLKLQLDLFRLGAKAPGVEEFAWDDRLRVQLQAGC